MNVAAASTSFYTNNNRKSESHWRMKIACFELGLEDHPIIAPKTSQQIVFIETQTEKERELWKAAKAKQPGWK
jgi:hypothetical protein